MAQTIDGHCAVALDVGGVLYYDEPFELAWLQGTFDLLTVQEPGYGMSRFSYDVETLRDGPHRLASALSAQAAAQSWARVRRAWSELSQEIPGAVRAALDIASVHRTVVVANQPPECIEVLTRWGLTDALDAVLLDSLVGHAKPDTRLLGLAAAGLDLATDDVLVVGNRVDHDVVPARALGCPVAFVHADDGYRCPPGVHPDIARAHHRSRRARTVAPPLGDHVSAVSSLSELRDRLTPPGTRRHLGEEQNCVHTRSR